MSKSNTDIRLVLAAALLCFAACGKKDDGATTPALSAPGAIGIATAQAEVKASSGPIELSLLLHKTQVQSGDYLWQQIRIRNVGETKILVSDRIFIDPRELRKQSDSGYGIHIEIHGPNGKPLKVTYQTSADRNSDIAKEVSGLLEVEGPKEQAMVDGWEKQGLSPREIRIRLIDFNTKKQREHELQRLDAGIELLPGQSAETKSAFYYSIQDKIHKRPMPRPIGDFAQLDFFVLNEPGEYKVRAIYDRAPTPDLNKMRGKLPIYPEEVLVRTPWISIKVLP